MNKKVIAMAIAATMAAPMAAQAEDGLKVSGRLQVEAVSNQATDYTDNGQGRLVFDYGMGSFMGRVAFDMRTTSGSAGKGFNFRDFYVGMKIGDGKVLYGQLGGAVKNIEKDPFIATFLQLRGSAVRGGNYGSSSFIGAQATSTVGNILGYRGKVAGMKLNVDFGSGYMGVGAIGESWYFGYNDGGTTGNATIKAGMTFGAIKVGYDTDSVNDSILLGYTMEDIAGGMLDITYATNGKTATNAYYRVAWKGKMAGGSVHAGLTMNGNVADTMQYGVGYMKKF